MKANPLSSLAPRRRAAALLIGLLAAALPLSSAPVQAACPEGVPQEACALLPSTPNLPIDNLISYGRSWIPAAPQVKINGYLYLHNADAAEHFLVIDGIGDKGNKKLGVGRLGPTSDKLQINQAFGYVAGNVYTFHCAYYPEMTGQLTVLR